MKSAPSPLLSPPLRFSHETLPRRFGNRTYSSSTFQAVSLAQVAADYDPNKRFLALDVGSTFVGVREGRENGYRL